MSSSKWVKRGKKLKGFFWFYFSFLLLRHTPFHTRRLEKQINDLSVKRLHIGCGKVLLKGWLNIAFERREEYGKIKTVDGTLYLNYNLLKRWPFDENSVECIAASHFIEHLDLNAGMEFTKKCFRFLKPNGVLRLSCPNLELYAKNYVERNRHFFENPLIREWCCFKNAATPGEIFIAKAYDSGGSHKWFYDFDSLKHILEAAGFKEIRKTTRLQGKTPDLEKLELPERELETVYVEGIKV